MRIVNAILSSQFPSRSFAATNCGYLLLREASIPMVRPVIMATPFSRIGVIFGFSSNFKVRWVNARRVIACMAYNHAFWDWANKMLISVAVGANGLFARQQKNAVSVAVFCAFPKPAIAGFINAAFEYIFRAKNGIISQFTLSMGHCVARAAKLASNGWRSTALNTFNYFFNLVRHGLPPKSLLCAITME